MVGRQVTIWIVLLLPGSKNSLPRSHSKWPQSGEHCIKSVLNIGKIVRINTRITLIIHLIARFAWWIPISDKHSLRRFYTCIFACWYRADFICPFLCGRCMYWLFLSSSVLPKRIWTRARIFPKTIYRRSFELDFWTLETKQGAFCYTSMYLSCRCVYACMYVCMYVCMRR